MPKAMRISMLPSFKNAIDKKKAKVVLSRLKCTLFNTT